MRVGPHFSAWLNRWPWRQGEHIFVSGDTGSGKSTLARALISKRLAAGGSVVFLVCKPADDLFTSPDFKGWTVLREWPKDGPAPWQQKILLWPRGKNLDTATSEQRTVFHDALSHIYRHGRRTVVMDEMLIIGKDSVLRNDAEKLAVQGRSNHVTMMYLSQRPFWIPQSVISSASHAFVASTHLRNDRKRLEDLGGRAAPQLAAALDQLTDRHDFATAHPHSDLTPTVLNLRK